MFCSQCGRYVHERSKFCANCGNKIIPLDAPELVSASRPRRLIVATVVTTILAGASLVWSLLIIRDQLWTQPSQEITALITMFPSIQMYRLTSSLAATLGNCAILLGAWLAYCSDTRGVSIVRISSTLMIAWACLCTFFYLDDLTSRANWDLLEPTTRGGLVGGAVGAGIGSILQLGLYLFLFRKSK